MTWLKCEIVYRSASAYPFCWQNLLLLLENCFESQNDHHHNTKRTKFNKTTHMTMETMAKQEEVEDRFRIGDSGNDKRTSTVKIK